MKTVLKNYSKNNNLINYDIIILLFLVSSGYN